jgi:hypothetical protein
MYTHPSRANREGGVAGVIEVKGKGPMRTYFLDERI